MKVTIVFMRDVPVYVSTEKVIHVEGLRAYWKDSKGKRRFIQKFTKPNNLTKFTIDVE